ncbi:MAG TPA: hypothetical protein VJT81_00170 [Burkholderiales bacterium]|nr:hypothetical protein [Burkholderiales bacterium]
MQTMNMEIRGLGSEPAVRGVRSALECIRGVAQVRIVPNERFVTVTYDAFGVSREQFNTAVCVMGCEVALLTAPTPQAPAEHRMPAALACAAAIVRSSDQRE